MFKESSFLVGDTKPEVQAIPNPDTSRVLVGLRELRDAAAGSCTCRTSPGPCPLHDDELDAVTHEIARARSLVRPWAFEFDIEHETIERIYREHGGES